MSAKVSGFSYSVSATPTITAGAYSADDALGDEMVLNVGIRDSGSADAFVIQSISILDKAKQSIALDLLFFDDTVTPAADNAAADFTDAQLASNFLGHVSIVAADYAALNDNSVATKRNVGLQLKQETGGTDAKIYCYAVTRGAPTYASTSDLVIKFDLACDQ